MTEIAIKTGKTEPEKTFETTLGEVGTHVFVDQEYFDRVNHIQDQLGTFLTDEDIKDLGLSNVKMVLMKQWRRRVQYVMRHMPAGKSIERSGFREAKNAVLSMLSDAQRMIMSKTPDMDVWRNCQNYFLYCDKLVADTFDSETNSIQKSLVVHGMLPEKRGLRTEESGMELSEAAKRFKEKNESG